MVELNDSNKTKFIAILENLKDITGNKQFIGWEDLESEDFHNYLAGSLSISRMLADIERTADEQVNYDILKVDYGSDEFWKRIDSHLSNLTINFFKIKEIRKMNRESRLELYKNTFNIIYKEREDEEYAADILKLSKDNTRILFKLALTCTDMIIGQLLSNRRFHTKIYSQFGLQDEDIDFLWNMYNSNTELIRPFYLRSQICLIHDKLDEINYNIGNVDDSVDLVIDGIDLLINADETFN